MGRRVTEESKSESLLKPIFGSKVGFFRGSNLDLVVEGSFIFNGLAEQLSWSMQIVFCRIAITPDREAAVQVDDPLTNRSMSQSFLV